MMKLFVSLLLMSVALQGHCYKFVSRLPESVIKPALPDQLIPVKPVIKLEDVEKEVLALQRNPSLLTLAPVKPIRGYVLSGELESNLQDGEQYLDAESEVADLLKIKIDEYGPVRVSESFSYRPGIVGDCPRNSEWTPWHNRDRPSGTGDWEVKSLYLPKGTCAEENASGIEARIVSSKLPYYMGGNVVTISPTYGFACQKNRQKGRKCLDYEIRFCCKPEDYNDGIVGSCPKDGVWTQWHNRDAPSGDGDWELRSLYQPKGTCADDKTTPPLAVQARLVSNKQPYQTGGDVVSINPSLGFVCRNRLQPDKRCDNYEVRYCCKRKDYNNGIVGTCPRGGTWTSWHNRDHPSGTGDWEVRSHYLPKGTCADGKTAPPAIQARLVSSKQPYQFGGDVVTINPAVGFICKNNNQHDGRCDNYEVRYCCPPQVDYNDGIVGNCPKDGVWTPWHNRDLPSGDGDYETRNLYQPPGTCADDRIPPLAIQARLVSNKKPYQYGYDIVTINTNQGFFCVNKLQKDRSCNDYEVRYCCRPTGVVGSCDPLKDEWTPWHNRDRPGGSGDWETRNGYLPRGTCASERAAPKAIQARLVHNKQPYTTSGENVVISPARGFYCINKNQQDRRCLDYEVRYCCPRKIIKECPGQLVKQKCGSKCPRICGRPIVDVCPQVCVPDQCECPDGLWQTKDYRCVPQKLCYSVEMVDIKGILG